MITSQGSLLAFVVDIISRPCCIARVGVIYCMNSIKFKEFKPPASCFFCFFFCSSKALKLFCLRFLIRSFDFELVPLSESVDFFVETDTWLVFPGAHVALKSSGVALLDDAPLAGVGRLVGTWINDSSNCLNLHFKHLYCNFRIVGFFGKSSVSQLGGEVVPSLAAFDWFLLFFFL